MAVYFISFCILCLAFGLLTNIIWQGHQLSLQRPQCYEALSTFEVGDVPRKSGQAWTKSPRSTEGHDLYGKGSGFEMDP